MKYRIRHYTEYNYQEVVSTCFNRLCLTPLSVPGQECISSEVNVIPEPDDQTDRTDFFGNNITFISIFKEHNKLKISSSSIVNIDHRQNAKLAATNQVKWKDIKGLLYENPGLHQDVIQYLLPSFHVPLSPVIKKFAEDCFKGDATLWNSCNALMRKIYSVIEFKPGFTTVNTPVESVVKNAKGVCQDFAHLMIACLRSMGLPARYVSGYLETIPPPGKEKLVGADASHAWVSVYFPSLGWVEFDPTNNLLPDFQHISAAYGRDYQDVAPIKGIVFSSGQQKLNVKVDVERLTS
jgi:transglutaminase-like putative cysteine protease